MNTFLDSLNLRPQERRIVVAIAAVVFVVLNLYLVVPHFGALARIRTQLQQTRDTMQSFNAKIRLDLDPKDGYQAQLAKLQQQQGKAATVSPASGQIQLQRAIMTHAASSGVIVNEFHPASVTHAGPTNEFFEEQSVKITVDTREEDLVNFLYAMGNDSSMVRVSELDLRPADANRYRLRGSIILTANYQKPPPGAAPAAIKPAAPQPKKPVPAASGSKMPPIAKPGS